MEIPIGVTEPEYRKAASIFSEAMKDGCRCVPVSGEEEALSAAVRAGQIQHVVVGVQGYRGALYEALERGSVIARFGVGHDGLDKDLATRRGILCTNTPGVLDDSVAEHAIGLLLALVRHTASVAARLAEGEWSPRLGIELAGKRLAVIGCGGIGRRVARIAARGFGMRVTGLKRSPSGWRELKEQFGFEGIVNEYEAAVREADFVSLHLPGGAETRQYLSAARLAALPVRSFLINTARGSVLDENALFDALVQDRLAGAALDVFEREPYQPQAPGKDLRQLPNVLMTPHIGSSTREACDRMARRALRNIRLAVDGKYREMDLLNPAAVQT